MKKKFAFFDKLKDKFKKSPREEDEQLEFDIDEELDEVGQSYEQDDDNEVDEDFTPQPMTLSQEQREVLDEGLEDTSPGLQGPPPIESTQEMERPTAEQMDEFERRERLESIRQNASEEDDFEEHSGINSYREFELPKSSPEGLKKGLKKWFGKIPWKVGVPKWRGSGLTPKRFLKESSLSKLEKPTFRWDNLVHDVFHVDTRPRIHKAFIALFICLSAYAAGKLTGLYIDSTNSKTVQAPSPVLEVPENNGQTQIQKIAQADLFNATPENDEGPEEPVREEPKVDQNLICLSAQRSSNLPIDLKNTVVLQDSVKSVASVQVRGEKDVMDIREGQKISNFAEVGRIDRQKLIFKNLNSGECEYIENAEKQGQAPKNFNVVSQDQGQKIMNSQSETAIANQGNSFSIKKSLRDEMLNNISEVLTQARAVQIQNPDGSYAFKMTEIVPGSIYSKLNIKNGDVIERIDGEKIEDLNAVMTKFGRIREIDNLSLTIKREGSSQTYDYSFE